MKKKVNVLRYEDRIVAEATIVANEGLTMRQVADRVGHCKSGVHRDCTELLKDLAKVCPEYKQLYKDTKKVIKKNKAERHLRGGEATKRVMATRRSNIKKAV